MIILGIDYGIRRMGLAISDKNSKIALPLETIEGDDEIFIGEIKRIVAERNVQKIVVGLPKHLSGDESEMSRRVKDFCKKLKILGIEIILFDERYTTVKAEEIVREMKKKPSRNKGKIDKIAASLILKNFLESQENFYASDDST